MEIQSFLDEGKGEIFFTPFFKFLIELLTQDIRPSLKNYLHKNSSNMARMANGRTNQFAI